LQSAIFAKISPKSSDLTPLDFYFWIYTKQLIYNNIIERLTLGMHSNYFYQTISNIVGIFEYSRKETVGVRH